MSCGWLPQGCRTSQSVWLRVWAIAFKFVDVMGAMNHFATAMSHVARRNSPESVPALQDTGGAALVELKGQ